MNFIDTQTSAIGQLASVGDKFLVVSSNCSSLSDSKIGNDVLGAFNLSEVTYVSPQRISTVSLETMLGNYSVTLHGVGNYSGYLKLQFATVNGSYVKNAGEVNIGGLLAKTCRLSKGDFVNVTLPSGILTFEVAGVVSTCSQLGSEILVPIDVCHQLTDDSLSFVEFSLNADVNKANAINRLSMSLPSDVSVVKVQQTAMFLQQSTGEVHNFLAVWSIPVYLMVVASSYVICTRLVVESEFELSMLRALGAKRSGLFNVIFSYALLATAAAAVLGVSLGITGTQVAASGLRWISQSIQVTPSLGLVEAAQLFGWTLAFSLMGCLYPALKATYRKTLTGTSSV